MLSRLFLVLRLLLSAGVLLYFFARFTNHNSFYLKTHKHVHKKYTKKKMEKRNKTEPRWMELVPRPRLVLHSESDLSVRIPPPSWPEDPVRRGLFLGRPVSCHRFVLCLWCLGQVRGLGEERPNQTSKSPPTTNQSGSASQTTKSLSQSPAAVVAVVYEQEVLRLWMWFVV